MRRENWAIVSQGPNRNPKLKCPITKRRPVLGSYRASAQLPGEIGSLLHGSIVQHGCACITRPLIGLVDSRSVVYSWGSLNCLYS